MLGSDGGGVVTIASLQLDLPPSVNNAFANRRGGGRCMSREYRVWRTKMRKRIAARMAQPRLLMPPYKVVIWVPAKMRGDISNRIKPIEDLLVDVGMLVDDRHVDALIVRRLAEIEAGTVTVIVRSLARSPKPMTEKVSA